VLHVDAEPVEAGVRERFSRVRAAERKPQAEERAGFGEMLLRGLVNVLIARLRGKPRRAKVERWLAAWVSLRYGRPVGRRLIGR